MSVDQNKAIVRRFYDEIINRGRFEIAEEIFAVDYTNHTAGGGIGTGRDGLIKGLKAWRAAFPDWTVTVNAMISEGDLVCDHVSIHAYALGSGTRRGGSNARRRGWRSDAFVAPVEWAACRGMVLRNTGGNFEGVFGSVRSHAEMMSLRASDAWL